MSTATATANANADTHTQEEEKVKVLIPMKTTTDRAENLIRMRILHTLSIFPKLSHSMLQQGIGTGFPPALWAPVLEDLVREGLVVRTQCNATHPVSQKEQTYTQYALATTSAA